MSHRITINTAIVYSIISVRKYIVIVCEFINFVVPKILRYSHYSESLAIMISIF